MTTSRFDNLTSFFKKRNMTIDDAIAGVQKKLNAAKEAVSRKDISPGDKMGYNWTIGLLQSYLEEYEEYKGIVLKNPKYTLWRG